MNARRLTVRPSARAAVGVVAVGVNVHATLGVGVVAGDVPADGRGRAIRGLLEGHGALDIAVSTEDGDCVGVMASARCSHEAERCVGRSVSIKVRGAPFKDGSTPDLVGGRRQPWLKCNPDGLRARLMDAIVQCEHRNVLIRVPYCTPMPLTPDKATTYLL